MHSLVEDAPKKQVGMFYLTLYFTYTFVFAAIMPLAGVFTPFVLSDLKDDFPSSDNIYVSFWIALATLFTNIAACTTIVEIIYRFGYVKTSALIVLVPLGSLALLLYILVFSLYISARSSGVHALCGAFSSAALLVAVFIGWFRIHPHGRQANNIMRDTTSYLSLLHTQDPEQTSTAFGDKSQGSSPEPSVYRGDPNIAAFYRTSTFTRYLHDNVFGRPQWNVTLILAKAIPLVVGLVILSFVTFQALSLVSTRPVPLPVSRSLRVHDFVYFNQTNRYTIDVYMNQLTRATVRSNCAIFLVHDSGRDSSEMLPLAASLAEKAPDCIIIAPDRIGYGYTGSGANPYSHSRDASVLNILALTVAAEQLGIEGLRMLPQLPPHGAFTTPIVTNTLRIFAAYNASNITMSDLSTRFRFGCVGHGTGAAVCDAWLALSGISGAPMVTAPSLGFVGIDYFSYFDVFYYQNGQDLQTAQQKVRQLQSSYQPLRVVNAPMGTARAMINPYDLYSILPSVSFLNGDSQAVLTLFNESLSSVDEHIQRKVNYSLFTNRLPVAMFNELEYQASTPVDSHSSQHTTRTMLLGISDAVCANGPTPVLCWVFTDQEERRALLASIQKHISSRFKDVQSEVYSGSSIDLYSNPVAIVETIMRFLNIPGAPEWVQREQQSET